MIGLEAGEAETVDKDRDPAGRCPAIVGASAPDFDGLVIPGGSVGADRRRGIGAVVALAARRPAVHGQGRVV